jgi:hypothetical protein
MAARWSNGGPPEPRWERLKLLDRPAEGRPLITLEEITWGRSVYVGIHRCDQE